MALKFTVRQILEKYASVKDVRVALRESDAFSDQEIDDIEAKLKKTLFD